MSKLSMERGDFDWEYTIRKKKGDITFNELMKFFHERDQLFQFDGDLVVIAFRVSSERDMFIFEDMCGKPEGDSLDVQIVTDDSKCPICGNTVYLQYCPDCGRKLFGKEGTT